MAPTQSLPLRETCAFLQPLLEGRRRILDVGCGRGELAAALARAGHDVTAIDVRLPEPRASAPGVHFQEVDFLRFDAPPFDAVLFASSLHHIAPLDAAVEHARRLLVPGGLLLAEEFALEAPDAATARWYYEVQALLAAAGRYPVAHIHGAPSAEPLERWRHEHTHHDEPLSEGRRMREEVARRLELTATHEGPYLYRYIHAGIAGTLGVEAPMTEALSSHVLEAERRGIAAGALRPVGLRLVARRA
jgi:2-polyprenyl-3-methyl-5-hydroxy-6-metoxy-1,4-benzoquinol methylase